MWKSIWIQLNHNGSQNLSSNQSPKLSQISGSTVSKITRSIGPINKRNRVSQAKKLHLIKMADSRLSLNNLSTSSLLQEQSKKKRMETKKHKTMNNGIDQSSQ
jgi:hypothetical protein